MSLRARILYAAGRIYWRLFRPVTFGVRLLMIRDNMVLLVKHTYQPNWYLPGGGIGKQETLEDVARREAWEEVGARLHDLQFFGMYTNLTPHKSDHVAVFLCHRFELEGAKDYEIECFEFFPMNDLPTDTSVGSRQRIEEYLSGIHKPGIGIWVK